MDFWHTDLHKQNKKSHSFLIRKVVIIAGWLIVWQLAAVLIDNGILMAGPWETLQTLSYLVLQENFWQSVAFSFSRIVGGFLCGAFVGIVLAFFAYRKPILGEILSPVVLVLKAVPVASFIILALIWFGSAKVSFIISFLVVFPMLYLNTQEGLNHIDTKLLEMAKVFHMPLSRQFRYIELPAAMPFLLSAFRLSLGMSWKSGVAAELIGQYKLSIGNQLYMDKITLDTAGLFAWTVVIILVSWLFEQLFLAVFTALSNWFCYESGQKKSTGNIPEQEETKSFQENKGQNGQKGNSLQNESGPCFMLSAKNICKQFDGKDVLQNLSLDIPSGACIVVTGASGEGKTTFLRILLGLEHQDSGTVEVIRSGDDIKGKEQGKTSGNESSSFQAGVVFQEDRLCEECSAVQNVMMVQKGISREEARKELEQVLPSSELDKPVKELSGGMRRRVCLIRACLVSSDILLLDEPFAGLDAASRNCCIDYILDKKKEKPLVITAHHLEGLEFCQSFPLHG